MGKLLSIALVGLLGLAPLAGAAEKRAAGGEGWEEKIEKALDKTVAFTVKGEALPDVLKTLEKAAGVKIILDTATVKGADKIRISLAVGAKDKMTLRSALGNVLKLAGLRYTLQDQAIFVSTRARIVGDLLVGVRGPAPAVPGVSYPMTVGDAVAATVDFFDGKEERLEVSITDFTRAPVDARFERPAYRDSLGRLHFPAPPMIIQGHEVLDPNRRFSSKPWFLRPEYLAPLYWGPQSQAVSKDEVRSAEALKALLQYMKKHPDITVGQLIQQLEGRKVRTKKK